MGRPAKFSVFLALLGTMLVSGCAEQERRAETAQAVTVSGVTTAEVINAAEAVLHQMRFTLEKADAEAGVVRTLPLTGGQFFEFWRSDNLGPAATLEANLHTLRRSVRMDFAQTDGNVRMWCTIRVQRLSLPENDASSVSQAYRIHSRSTRTIRRIELNPSQKQAMSWIELGDDPKLAAEILRKTARNIERSKKDETT